VRDRAAANALVRKFRAAIGAEGARPVAARYSGNLSSSTNSLLQRASAVLPYLRLLGVFLMKIRGLFATVALLLTVVFSSQSAYATDHGPGFLGTFPFYSGDYPYYDGDYPPNPLIAPYGYYGCRSGCCRQPVWTGRHWHNATTCYRETRSSARQLRLK
jgi:hypothetical protein